MGDPAHVPELGEDGAPLGVHGIGHPFPASDLLGAVDPRRPGVALAHGVDLGAFADDQARLGALGVVARHHGVGHITRLTGTGAGHGGHDDAVGKVQLAEAQRAEQVIVAHLEFLMVEVRPLYAAILL